MTVCSTTALRKYLTQHSNLGQPSREKAVSTTRAHAEGETIINSGRYRRPLFKSSHGAPPAPGDEQVERDRAPAVLVHQPELASNASGELSGDRRPDRGDHDQDRPERALRRVLG